MPDPDMGCQYVDVGLQKQEPWSQSCTPYMDPGTEARLHQILNPRDWTQNQTMDSTLDNGPRRQTTELCPWPESQTFKWNPDTRLLYSHDRRCHSWPIHHRPRPLKWTVETKAWARPLTGYHGPSFLTLTLTPKHKHLCVNPWKLNIYDA